MDNHEQWHRFYWGWPAHIWGEGKIEILYFKPIIISGSIHSGFNNFLSMCQCKLIGGWQHTIFSHHLPLGHKRGHVFTCAYVRMLDPHVFTHFSYAGAKFGKANGGHVRKRSWIQSNGHHHSIYACSHLSCVSSVAKTWKSRTVRWAR